MFKPVPMQKISLQVLREDAPAASVALADSGVFNPETLDDQRLDESPAEDYYQVYARGSMRLSKIRADLVCSLDIGETAPRAVSLGELERIDHRLGALWREFSSLEEERRTLSERRHAIEQLSESLERFASLDMDLSLLQERKQFLSLHIGTVPLGNLPRLRSAAPLAGHFLRLFSSVGDTAYVVVAGPTDAARDMDALLSAAAFRTVTIPPEFRDTPEKIRADLGGQARELDAQLTANQQRMEVLGERHKGELTGICKTLYLASPYARLAKQLRARGGLAALDGWIPLDEVHALASRLHESLSRPFVMNARHPLPEEHAQVPSVMRHPRVLAPFAALVRNFGVPRYGEFDPTVLFAVTFVLMFGMMFGDVGHGAVIAGGGLTVRRRYPDVTIFLVTAGLSSMVFGMLYGSLFGFEDVIHPLWMAPLSDPLLMLKIALYWGIGFILLANLLTIYNLLGEGRRSEALLDNRGVAGLVLYLGGLFAGFRWMGSGQFGALEGTAIALPLAVILTYKWRESKNPLGEKLLVVAVEGFESIMNYLANTLSFLRVAAFSLNHVALAVAVFTLAGMMDSTGHWITVVLGNVFIIVVEGAIVTIQVLRLEYYEGFSRFFSGDGRPFRPLTYGWGTGD